MNSSEGQAIHRPSYLYPVFFGSFSFVFLNFSLPIRADDLGIDAVGIGGMYAVFTGAMLLFRPIVGYCLDRLGRHIFFSSAFFFYVLAMLLFVQSNNIYDFYLARFLQGIGASLMWVSARTMTSDLNKAKSAGSAMGILTTTSVRGSMVGATYGFTLLGFLPMQSAWVWAFGGYALMSVVAFGFSLKVKETSTRVFSTNSQDKINRAVPWSPNLAKVMFIVFLSAFASALIEPIYLLFLKTKFDINVIILALVFFPAGLVHAILPRYSGQWSDKWGRGKVIAIGLAIAGCLSIALPYWQSLYFIAVSYVLFSIGWAMASPAEDALVNDISPIHLRGTVMGIKEGASGTGSALGPLAGGYIYEYWAKEMAFVSNGILLIVVAMLALFWFKQKISSSKV
nr:MFS transporter [uncultured Glaciecola sp.]